MIRILLFPLFFTAFLPVFSQAIPPEVWLGICGSEPEVLAQVEQLTAGGEYVVMYGEYCSRKTGDALPHCREIAVQTGHAEEAILIFHHGVLFRIEIRTRQTAHQNTSAWRAFCRDSGLMPIDHDPKSPQYRLIASSHPQSSCALEADFCTYFTQTKADDASACTTTITWQYNPEAPLFFIEGCDLLIQALTESHE